MKDTIRTTRLRLLQSLQGKTNAAMELLTDIDAGVHKVDDTILNKLQQTHPQPAPLTSNTLFNGPVNRVMPSYFNEIDKNVVFKSVSMTKGSGGPSKHDVEQFRRLLMSNKYKNKNKNKELRFQLDTLAKRLATDYLDPNTLEAFVACRLIPFDKNSGMRPIDIGEVSRRIVGECISWVLRKDIQQAAGPLLHSYWLTERRRRCYSFNEINILTGKYRWSNSCRCQQRI